MWSAVAAAAAATLAAGCTQQGKPIEFKEPEPTYFWQNLFGRLIGTALILSPIALLGWVYI